MANQTVHGHLSSYNGYSRVFTINDEFSLVSTLVWTISTLFVIIPNALCLLALRKVTQFNEITKVFLKSLTTADMFNGIVYGIPIIIVSAVKYWPFGKFICCLQSFIGYNVVIAGSFSIFAVNVERFIAIVYPLHYPTLLTLRRAQWITVTLWILASIVTLIYGISTHWDYTYLPYFNHCAFAPSPGGGQFKFLFLIPFIMGFHVPYFTTIILYLKIIKVSLHHKQQIAAMPTYPAGRPDGKLDMKAATTSFLILSVYSFVEIPIQVILITGLYEFNEYSILFLRLLWFSASWMDVFIYFWRNKQFRVQFIQLFKARVANL